MIANGSPTRAAAFSVALFGSCRFALDDTAYAFLRRRSALPLLVFLALKRAAPVARDYVAFSLWPDECEDRARELLRRNLFLLARSMPGARLAPWIVAENDTLQWNARAPWQLDVARFEEAYLCGDPARLATAVEIYRGDLCEGLYDEWIFGERERLRGCYLDALDRLVRVHHGRGEPGLALGYALRARAAEPWREDVARRVMRLRFELGDRGGAIAEFDTFARRLREEYGADPMPETLVARDAILRSGSLAALGPEGPGPVARAARTSLPTLPLAGRERDLQALGAAWSRASRGEGSVVLVTGEAGIGKTRLLAELALAVDAEGGRVLCGSTSTPERRAYEAIGDALAGSWRLFAELPIGAPELAALATVVPELRGRCKLQWSERGEPIREQARLFEALARAVAALAAQRPTLLVLDDLHAAGEATLTALAHVAATSANVPLLIVAAFRTDRAAVPGGRWRPERSGVARIATLPLARLNAGDVALAAGACSREPEVLEELALACGGNPRTLETLLRECDHVAGLPLSIVAAARAARLRARLDGCSADARALCETAAIAGSQFEVEIVARALGFDERRAWDALDDLIDRGFVEDCSRGSVAYRFTDPSERARIERSVAEEVRRNRHRRLAAVLQAFDREDDDRSREIARHAERGGDSERAARAYAIAAERASAAYALEHARELEERGLRCSPRETVFALD